MKNLLSTVCQIANALVYTEGWNRSEAFKQAWKVAKLRQQMAKGFVSFAFVKVSGEMRKAEGTINPSFINYQAKGGRAKNPLQVPYFDKGKGVFRSFKAQNLAA